MTLSGTVIRGDGRGRQLGFPTANLDVDQVHTIPEAGVYAGLATLNGTRYLAAIHIGPRPTFPSANATVEAHILDFDMDIYGADITLTVKQKIRDIEKFASIAELVAAIEQDCKKVRTLLAID